MLKSNLNYNKTQIICNFLLSDDDLKDNNNEEYNSTNR